LKANLRSVRVFYRAYANGGSPYFNEPMFPEGRLVFSEKKFEIAESNMYIW